MGKEDPEKVRARVKRWREKNRKKYNETMGEYRARETRERDRLYKQQARERVKANRIKGLRTFVVQTTDNQYDCLKELDDILETYGGLPCAKFREELKAVLNDVRSSD